VKIIECDGKEFVDMLQSHVNGDTYGCVCFGCGNFFQNEMDERVIPYIHHIVDSNHDKMENGVSLFGKSFIVEPVSNLKKVNWSNNCLLISTNFFGEVIQMLQAEGLDKQIQNVYLLPMFRFQNISQTDLYQERVINLAIDYERVKCGTLDQHAQMEIRDKYLNAFHHNQFIIPKIVFLLTTRCTLRCKDCTALIPKLSNPPIDLPVEQLKRDIDCILGAVEEIQNLQLAGGESLLYPYLDEVLEYVLSKEKVKNVHFVTNGTVMPKEKTLTLLQNSKVYIYISDYGFVDKMNKIRTMFDSKGINYTVLKDMEWIKVGDSSPRHKFIQQMKWEYLHCPNGRGCKMVIDGKLFPCDRSGRMYLEALYNKLQYEPYDAKEDYVEIYDCNQEELVKRIKSVYLNECITACDYCDYANISAPKIVPAKQE
jgi:organic radical activating enzyme